MSCLLLATLAIAGWLTSHHARESWWPTSPHLAIRPDSSGLAWHEGLGAAVEEVAVIDAIYDQRGQALRMEGTGYRLWHVAVRMDIAESRLEYCDIVVQDDHGRLHKTNNLDLGWMDGYETLPTCQERDPDDWRGQPGEVQLFTVALPEDAEPAYVRVQGFALNPHFLELPVR